MSVGVWAGVATAVSMLAFVLVVFWACSPRRRTSFEQTAALALEEDKQP